MKRSGMPVPSLLGLFGALLVLCLELPGCFSNVALSDPKLQAPLAAALEKYNGRSDSGNYFKVRNVKTARYEMSGSGKLYLRVEMVKTACEKMGNRLTYEKIQECEPLPGNPEIRRCTFIITYQSQGDSEFTVGNNCG